MTRDPTRYGDGTGERFLVELVKPSHYDDDGYVIQWWKAWIPSNSLSSVYGIARDCEARKVLGPGVEIEIGVWDETNAVVPVDRIAGRFQRNGHRGLVCLVGVQTNQFPRAADIARRLRRAGVPVAIGGFHVSGCLAMLAELPSDLQEMQDIGVTLFAGEAESGRFEQVLRDAHRGTLASLYDYMKDLPGLGGQTVPFLPERFVRRYAGALGCFDAGRGCPFTCSFCTIINVQGRESRFRDADDVERLIRTNYAQGVVRYFITDDNFARNRNWEAIFDRIIALREEAGLDTHFIIQVDTLCHRIPRFVEKAARAGCKRVFIGLENVNPDNLKIASKGQNKITEYRAMLQAWRTAGVLTYCGYILGFPGDTPESIERDIEIIKRELPIDLLEFFILTPLPGSADHKVLHDKGVWMDPDMNKYNLEHVTTGHPLMSAEALQGAYDRAWHQYYSWPHIETLMKRVIAARIKPARLGSMIFQFYASYRFERVHPLQSGVFRRKVRTERRSSLPRESIFVFYPRRVWEVLTTYLPGLWFAVRLTRLRKRLQRDPAARGYMDDAIRPVEAGGEERLELFTVTEAAQAEVAKQLRSRERIARAREPKPVADAASSG